MPPYYTEARTPTRDITSSTTPMLEKIIAATERRKAKMEEELQRLQAEEEEKARKQAEIAALSVRILNQAQ